MRERKFAFLLPGRGPALAEAGTLEAGLCRAGPEAAMERWADGGRGRDGNDTTHGAGGVWAPHLRVCCDLTHPAVAAAEERCAEGAGWKSF